MRTLFQVDADRKWCQRWISADLSPRKSKYLADKRADAGILSEVAVFIQAVEDALQVESMTAVNCVNYDKFRVCVTS